MKILAQGHGCTNDPTQIKDGPEDANEFPFLILSRVSKHERSLCCPKQTGTHAKHSSCRNNETPCVAVDVDDTESGDQ
jgi:hypothetical protein